MMKDNVEYPEVMKRIDNFLKINRKYLTHQLYQHIIHDESLGFLSVLQGTVQSYLEGSKFKNSLPEMIEKSLDGLFKQILSKDMVLKAVQTKIARTVKNITEKTIKCFEKEINGIVGDAMGTPKFKEELSREVADTTKTMVGKFLSPRYVNGAMKKEVHDKLGHKINAAYFCVDESTGHRIIGPDIMKIFYDLVSSIMMGALQRAYGVEVGLGDLNIKL